MELTLDSGGKVAACNRAVRSVFSTASWVASRGEGLRQVPQEQIRNDFISAMRIMSCVLVFPVILVDYALDIHVEERERVRADVFAIHGDTDYIDIDRGTVDRKRLREVHSLHQEAAKVWGVASLVAAVAGCFISSHFALFGVAYYLLYVNTTFINAHNETALAPRLRNTPRIYFYTVYDMAPEIEGGINDLINYEGNGGNAG